MPSVTEDLIISESTILTIDLGVIDLGEDLTIFEDIAIDVIFPTGLIQTGLNIVVGETYRMNIDSATTDGSLIAYQGTQKIWDSLYTGTPFDFIADSSGNSISIFPRENTIMTVDNISIRRFIKEAVAGNFPVKNFLNGELDEGNEIFFRADTQTIQLQTDPEKYSVPISTVSDIDRGGTMKVFASLNDGQYYELEGTANKGVSILKFNQPTTDKVKPPLVQSVQLSYRDSSKQLCRLNQLAIIFTDTKVDYSS